MYNNYTFDCDFLMKTVSSLKGDSLNFVFEDSRIIVIRRGRLRCNLHGRKDQLMDEGHVFLVPSGYNLSIDFEQDSSLLLIRITEKPLLSIPDREQPENAENDHLYPLKINYIIEDYLQLLDTYLKQGLNHPNLLKAKTTELFCLLDAFYDRQELAAFLSLYLTDDYGFKEQIRLNHLKVKTVRELADLLHYSYSGFNKRFKRSFGVSAYSWMQQQRARLVYRELLFSEKPLKEISLDYSFVSLSHFNEFCHKELGASPSRIRKSRTPDTILN